MCRHLVLCLDLWGVRDADAAAEQIAGGAALLDGEGARVDDADAAVGFDVGALLEALMAVGPCVRHCVRSGFICSEKVRHELSSIKVGSEEPLPRSSCLVSSMRMSRALMFFCIMPNMSM